MMTSGTGPAGRPPGFNLRTGRMEAFSDGVFAIAITLLVLDLVVPEASGGDVGDALPDQWPIYLGYVVSFASIGASWLAHSVIGTTTSGPSPRRSSRACSCISARSASVCSCLGSPSSRTSPSRCT